MTPALDLQSPQFSLVCPFTPCAPFASYLLYLSGDSDAGNEPVVDEVVTGKRCMILRLDIVLTCMVQLEGPPTVASRPDRDPDNHFSHISIAAKKNFGYCDDEVKLFGPDGEAFGFDDMESEISAGDFVICWAQVKLYVFPFSFLSLVGV